MLLFYSSERLFLRFNPFPMALLEICLLKCNCGGITLLEVSKRTGDLGSILTLFPNPAFRRLRPILGGSEP